MPSFQPFMVQHQKTDLAGSGLNHYVARTPQKRDVVIGEYYLAVVR